MLTQGNLRTGLGPQILQSAIQNSDHHDDMAPRIYPALFFPLEKLRSSAALGRNADDMQRAFVFIYRDGNGAQLPSSHPAAARVKAKSIIIDCVLPPIIIGVSSIETPLTECCL